MDKRDVRVTKRSLDDEDDPLRDHEALTPAERIELVGELTRLAWAIQGRSDTDPHFRDVLSALAGANVEFLLIGAHALAAHGLVRAASDIDIWAHRTPENAIRVQEALLRFGAPREQVGSENFLEPRAVIQLGVPPFRIDVMTDITGVEWDEAWAQRVSTDLDGHEVCVLSRDHLLANKRATNRPQDQLDVKALELRSPKR